MVRRRNATARGRRRYCRPGPRGARRKRHELEGRNPGVPGFEKAGETVKKPPLHVAVAKYLEQIEALKKPNTHRKYEAVLERFLDFFRDRDSIDAITSDDLTRFVVTLKKDHGLGSNTILHNAVIIAQFLKRHGRSGITRELQLPERITPLVKVYRHEELARFFAACSDLEGALFATFLLTGFRGQEVMGIVAAATRSRTIRVPEHRPQCDGSFGSVPALERRELRVADRAGD